MTRFGDKHGRSIVSDLSALTLDEVRVVRRTFLDAVSGLIELGRQFVVEVVPSDAPRAVAEVALWAATCPAEDRC